MEELSYWVALNMIPGIGAIRFKSLLKRFGSPQRVLSASIEELAEVKDIGRRRAELIVRFRERMNPKRELELIKSLGIRVITLADGLYPANLKSIYDPPPVLYLKGELYPEDRYALAIVGSRLPTPYGRMMAERLANDLALRGLSIVSGLARGIDSIAHKSALTVGGRTIAVLGCGIDIVYPRENKKLMEEIANSGAVISEFPLGTLPLRGNFPLRNRVISGLSLGVVVVEAREKSGALITANSALEQGREVFAVPGNATSRTSRGTNWLIKEGAKLVEDSEDILEELEPLLKGLNRAKREETKPLKAVQPKTLSPEAEKIYNLLSDEPQHIDAIIQRAQMEVNKVAAVLALLEIKGLARQLPGKIFLKK